MWFHVSSRKAIGDYNENCIRGLFKVRFRFQWDGSGGGVESQQKKCLMTFNIAEKSSRP